ncbi:hypothetical protein [Halobacillus sp. Marseille-Q1614]|uniref:hypothetical protein n=1 Tax=Halobacillus sp. Marseille-Q1614 TaxID=2709134 RepID=UPI00156E8E6C|nr:hypothetical protein [Halobacillus sp. Marseille-Q1614]
MVPINEVKEKIINHHVDMIQWVQSLRDISKEEWFHPIQENKWCSAEIISHFIPWDEFILKDRIPYLFTDRPLPKAPEAQALNEKAAMEGRRSDQLITIDRFVEIRTV